MTRTLAVMACLIAYPPCQALELNGITITNDEDVYVTVNITDCNDKPLIGGVELPLNSGFSFREGDTKSPLLKFDCLKIKADKK